MTFQIRTYETMEDKLERLLATKARSLQGDPQFRLKLLKFGLSRGYEYEAVEEALNNLPH